jgi:hypothetical protein
MPVRTLSPCPLPGGGVRYPFPGSEGLTGFLIFSGLVLWGLGPAFLVDFLFNPRHVAAPRGWLFVAPIFPLVWFALLFARLFLVRAITVADGRIGLAWWVGRRMLWGRWRHLAGLRRLVVRRDGDSLLVGFDASKPLVLLRRWQRGALLDFARELAGRCQALTGVAVSVGEEELPFTRNRAEQPIFSRVKECADGPLTTFTFPTVRWSAKRTEAVPWRLWVDGRGYLVRCAVGVLVVLFGVLVLLGAGYTAVNHVRGRTGPIVVGTGTVRLPAKPNPSVAVRVREAATNFALTLVCDLAIGAVGVWLVVRALKEANRRLGETVTRQRIVLDRSRPLVVALRSGELSLVVAGDGEVVRWSSTEIDSAEAFHTVVVDTQGESGSQTVSVYTGLRIETISGEEWLLQGGTDHADWSWLATRLRAALALEAGRSTAIKVAPAAEVTADKPSEPCRSVRS